jgi:hypothetical protein
MDMSRFAHFQHITAPHTGPDLALKYGDKCSCACIFVEGYEANMAKKNFTDPEWQTLKSLCVGVDIA